MMSMQSITTWPYEGNEPIRWAERFAHLEGTALLYSGGSYDSAASSYLCLYPDDQIIVQDATPQAWHTLRARVGLLADQQVPPLPTWVGYLSYEMGSFSPLASSSVPAALFYRPTVIVHFDHKRQQANLYTKGGKPFSLPKQRAYFPQEGELVISSLSDSLESYLEKIAQIKEWIVQGEVYQVNLSQEIGLAGRRDPFTLFREVDAINPAPFSAFLHCVSFSLVSSSPERFICKQGACIEARPIKGTMPRGQTAEEDIFLRQQLLSSEKERAELLMITDLLRNDIGKIALPGSVLTRELLRCEAYTNVFHLLSIITGQVDTSWHPVEIVHSLFPGGSITGCPKSRALHYIQMLEKRARGIYTGAIGYFAANGDMDFNLAIRTLVVYPAHIQLQLGGAIVIDSDPYQEYAETLHKGRSLFAILGINPTHLSV